jgi:hypothetical protein
MVSVDIFLQNYDIKPASEQARIMDLLNTIPELESFVEPLLIRYFDKISLK